MEDKLLITPAPHITSKNTVRGQMLDVVIALVPASIAAVVIFGVRSLWVILASLVSAVAAEAIYQKLLKKPLTINDMSATVTGLLLALTLPPGVPIWVPIIGSAFAIVIAKQIFGGLGTNFINPALAGRAFVLAAWPLHMTHDWVTPMGYDALTGATPLVAFNSTGRTGLTLKELFLGLRAGSLGETCVIALLAGGVYLIVRDVIDWRIPVGYLGTLALGTWIFGSPNGLFQGDWISAIFLGGAVLGSFFMATDYVTSPVTRRGRLFMGIGAGIVTLLIRLWGSYPEGVTYAILFMNLVTPLIDKYVVPKYYGYAHDVQARRAAGGATK
ncbi:MAG: RnfABCDGE type electron transport complex subunit D [Firmicutes bacterium]|jgi:electron transport complex protein RnfD|nr:RnfABCDGE type electron transport complex subunit D [Candidatus Fermentithermobacillaceae bacterium]